MNADESKQAAPSKSAASPAAPRRRRRLSLLGSVLGPFVALGAVVLFFGVADQLTSDNPTFLTSSNFRTVAVQTATIAVAALGMTVVIIAGGIDLSAGTALALCATVLAWCLKNDVALLILEGENVASAASRLDEATTRLERLPRLIERAESDDRRQELRDEQQQLEQQIPSLSENLEQLRQRSAAITPYTPTLAVAASIVTGCLCGFLNGALISALRVVPFIVTLGTMQVYLGLAKIIANETTVRPDRATQIPDWMVQFTSIRSEALWGTEIDLGGPFSINILLPLGVWLALALAAVLALVLRYTVFSRHAFAIGSNELTARLCGINVTRNKIAVYTLAGFFVGIAGLYQFSRLSSGNPTSGIGMELRIIAAVVIGGGSLSGGRGSVLGSLTGAAIIFVIGSGCTQLGLSNPIQDVILGVIVVTAVAIDQLRQRRLAD